MYVCRSVIDVICNIWYKLYFQVFIVSGNVIKIYAEGGLAYSVHGLGTEVLYCFFLQLSVVKSDISVIVIINLPTAA